MQNQRIAAWLIVAFLSGSAITGGVFSPSSVQAAKTNNAKPQTTYPCSTGESAFGTLATDRNSVNNLITKIVNVDYPNIKGINVPGFWTDANNALVHDNNFASIQLFDYRLTQLSQDLSNCS